MSTEQITVEVAYALPQKQKIVSLQVAPGTTALEAAKLSNIDKEFPEIDLDKVKMGIFGQALGTKGLKKAHLHPLQEGDRVEIYRPLISDPKEARRRRAAKAEAEQAK